MSESRWIIVLPPNGAARTVAITTANAFKELLPGHRFKCFDSATYLDGFSTILKSPDEIMIVDLMNQAFTVACFDFKATHCLTGALAPITLFTLQLLRKHGIINGLWFYEDYQRATYIDRVLSGYNHIFAIQRGELEAAICATTDSTYHFLPTAAAVCSFPYQENPREYDIIFIGVLSTYRAAMLEQLTANGFKVVIAGAGWDAYRGPLQKSIISTSWCDERTAFELMQKSKIGLNLSIDEPFHRQNVHISPRLFDYVAAGCIAVSEDVPLLKESFHNGIVHTFTTTGEMNSIVRSLCINFSSEGRNRALNRSTVISYHQYIHRATAIIEAMHG